jgi:hypothetical protein
MQALAMVAEGSVTILSHPSLAGIASGSGISGSTARQVAHERRGAADRGQYRQVAGVVAPLGWCAVIGVAAVNKGTKEVSFLRIVMRNKVLVSVACVEVHSTYSS